LSILLDSETRVIVQGITGRDGSFHALAMHDYGTRVVGGVTPGKGGQTVGPLPVFNSVAEAVRETGANCTVIFVPARFAAAALSEAVTAGIGLIVCITEGIPVLDLVAAAHQVAQRGLRLIGPNCPGVICPGIAKVGIMPAQVFAPGRVGVISRSGTLTYEVVHHLTRAGLGQSTCVGVGGDPIVGSRFVDLLRLFEADPGTDCVALVGEIGGDDEEQAAEFVRTRMTKRVAAFISGRTAPPGKRMGHAGAIISGGKGTAAAKVAALTAAGVTVVDRPDQIAAALAG
jgi:succinyl-CoA synthetase alpha subunit